MDQEGLLKLQAIVGEVVMEEMGDGVEVMEEVEMVVEVMVVEVEVIDKVFLFIYFKYIVIPARYVYLDNNIEPII